jgi:hypothetical protein
VPATVTLFILYSLFSNVKLGGAFLDRLRKCDVLRSLVDIVPAYAKLIATTKPIPKAIGNEVRNILYPAIAHVLTETRKFCGKPIFAFFDDVQWTFYYVHVECGHAYLCT